jgi:cyclic beta-1,2-glucan synthetase
MYISSYFANNIRDRSENMENFAKKLAIDQKISKYSSKNSFPLRSLNEDFEVIRNAYDILSESVSKNVPIPPSGEWLLDNFYLIEEQVNAIKNSLNLEKYIKLPSVDGVARVYSISRKFVGYTDGVVTKEGIETFINAYQTKKVMNENELYELPAMLQLALIENIKNISFRIIAGQLQKFKVESLIERIIKNKEQSKQRFHKYRGINLNNEASSYVEYLIYLLKKMGKKGKPYLDILEDEINKIGTTSAEIVKAEHYDMAVRRVSISNSILSIKNITRLNWNSIFENISPIEKILLEDDFYERLDFDTKEMYRKSIKRIANKADVSEIYVATMVVEAAIESNAHIGEFLIGERQEEFLKYVGYENSFYDNLMLRLKKQKLFWYLTAIYLPTLLLSIYISKNYFLILFIPLSEVFVSLVNRVVSKNTKPKIFPKLEKIDNDVNTFVIVPTLLNSAQRVENMIKNLETYYLGNKMNGLFFCLLGDVSEEKMEVVAHDEEVEKTGLQEIEKLNKKYNTDIFHFIYRKRVYNKTQEKWLGYERKRGMIEEFNDFLVSGNQGTFRVNTIRKIPKIKYVITLDADTELPPDSAKKLIGTMEHPINKPVVEDGVVKKGYGLIQPKVGISIKSWSASLFSKLFAGSGGIDIYSTAESNVYQDLFGEAIFTGKGIYNVEVFNEVLSKKLPENMILSHDLLEGSFVRAGLASDIELIDGFPSRVNSYMLRLHRWTRGDWQIISFLKNKKINSLSKYKILDNLRRSLVDIFTLLLFFCGFFWIPIFIIFLPFILDVLNSALNVGCDAKRCRNYLPMLTGIKGSFYRCLINLILLAYKAIVYFKAITVTLYRLFVSKKHLLEWVTAADAEKMLGRDLKCYLSEMIGSPIVGVLLVCSTLLYNSLSLTKVTFLLVLWIIAPVISYLISKSNENEEIKLSKNEKGDLLDLAKRTWSYFETFMNKENNYLPPDNYQENRKNKLTGHTSTTNIGLGLLAIISARDLGFIDTDKMINMLEKSINTIKNLKRWNGHLYNWYNIKTLEPLSPAFISTVDSGNFVGYLFVVRNVLEKENKEELMNVVNEIIANTDFSKLYDYDKSLFSIGYDFKENNLVDSYYDLLASESRQASFIAIAKRDISYKHWFNLGRALTVVDGYKGLVSWSGTMFEYFMPNVIMPSYEYSLLEETYRFCLYSQKKYANKLGVPWGISESAFSLQDLNYNYQYKAFGIPWLGLKRGLKEDVVVAPYASLITINKNYKDVLRNMELLKDVGAYDKFGFYESIDYTPSRVTNDKRYEVVLTYMAHHQGLILLAINNLINKNILQKRFSDNPEIKAVDILLQEKIPQTVVYTKEKKEKIDVLKYKGYDDYKQHFESDTSGMVNVMTNDKYTLVINDFGEGYSKLRDIYVNKYNDSCHQSNVIYIKNTNDNIFWSSTLYPTLKEPDEYLIYFSPGESKFYRRDGDIETITRISVSPEENVELRQVEIRNVGESKASVDVMSYIEPILAEKNSDIAHPVYNNLFLRAINLNGKVLIEKRFPNGNKMFFTNFAVCDDQDVKFEVELDKSKIIGRMKTMETPEALTENRMFSNNISPVVNTTIAIKTSVTINENSSVVINYYYGISTNKDDIGLIIEKFSRDTADKRLFELAKSRCLIENRFVGLKGNEIELYNKLFAEILKGSKSLDEYKNIIENNQKNQRELWRFGISGDYPIILVKIKNVNDAYIIKQLVKAIDYFNIKNIKIDLVIVDEENGNEKYVYSKIIEYIFARNISYLINSNGGFHIIKAKDLVSGDIELLFACSDVIFKAEDGFLEEQLE